MGSCPADFLVEIGTEELPPRALPDLVRAFARSIEEGLDRERLAHGEVAPFATPRRLAVRVGGLAACQPDREQELRGPPVAVAFDESGAPTRAARAFAEKCGVSVEDLERQQSARGEWLVCRTVEAGRTAAELLPGIVEESLQRLPVPRRMRWGAGDVEFVRPVHWVVLLHGDEVVPGHVVGIESGRTTRGHRFHAPGDLSIASAETYPGVLEEHGFVVADFSRRRRRIVEDVRAAAAGAGGIPLASDALYDEVTALTEWPVALTGHFDEAWLELPREVIAATLTTHQRTFPITDASGKLLPRFVVVANIESAEPGRVLRGNERVIRPRLADAAFFWSHDRQRPLAERRAALGDIVYQQGLGSIADKSDRVARLAGTLAAALGGDSATVRRAALLAKCDLTTGMVGEFPELQGVMGRYYALDSGEDAAVAEAIGEQYLPRYGGDALPATEAGMLLAVADRIDSLAGAFALGRRPTGNRDPFGLRRAALGVVRIGIECSLNFELVPSLEAAVEAQPVNCDRPAVAGELADFLLDRLRSWYAERGVEGPVFEAVRARAPATLPDFDARIAAVSAFVRLEQAESLSAANKRIANILRQSGRDEHGAIDEAALEKDAERHLATVLAEARADLVPLLERRAYADALARLAGLRETVDRFFDDVLVMTDDPAARRNRLALLASLRALFLEVADISVLAVGASGGAGES